MNNEHRPAASCVLIMNNERHGVLAYNE